MATSLILKVSVLKADSPPDEALGDDIHTHSELVSPFHPTCQLYHGLGSVGHSHTPFSQHHQQNLTLPLQEAVGTMVSAVSAPLPFPGCLTYKMSISCRNLHLERCLHVHLVLSV